MRFWLLALCLFLWPTNSVALDLSEVERVTRVVPLFDSYMVTHTPTSWTPEPATSALQDGFYLMELLPKGQTLGHWRELISLMAFENSLMEPMELFGRLYKAQEKTCTHVAAEVIEESSNHMIGLLLCSDARTAHPSGIKPGQGEIAIYRIEKQGLNLLSLFKSWRGKAYDINGSDSQFPASYSEIKSYLGTLKEALFCSQICPALHVSATLVFYLKSKRLDKATLILYEALVLKFNLHPSMALPLLGAEPCAKKTELTCSCWDGLKAMLLGII